MEARFEALGTEFLLRIAHVDEIVFTELLKHIKEMAETFERTYSRFRSDSLVTKISKAQGTYEVPKDFITMLSMYRDVYIISERRFTPLIGTLLEDSGYDKDYSLTEREKREIPDLFESVHILDGSHIETQTPVLFDFGAVGKGYLVDLVVKFLKEQMVKEFLFDGSGDMYYVGKKALKVGLEDPDTEGSVIGTVAIEEGALCGSGTNRRAWGKYHHYLDPSTKESTVGIRATWVRTNTTAYADLYSSLLFFVSPEKLTREKIIQPFEYTILYDTRELRYSKGFGATYFVQAS